MPFARTTVFLAILLAAGGAHAQLADVPTTWQPYKLATGLHSNPSPAPQVVFSHEIRLQSSVVWQRVFFEDVRMEKGSSIRITSRKDGGSQTLDAVQIEQWGFGSAYFNGAAVLFELIAGPGTTANSLRIENLLVCHRASQASEPPESICGFADDRSPATAASIGRLMTTRSSATGVCTATIIHRPLAGLEKVHLTAGHCFEFDAQNGAVTSAILEFNVPGSYIWCDLDHPNPIHQYAVDLSSVVRSNSAGNDWAVFRCFSTAFPSTFVGQGFAAESLASSIPAPGEFIWIAGYGADGTTVSGSTSSENCDCNSFGLSGSRNFTLQIEFGTVLSTPGTEVRYNDLDTCGGNSGSVINSALGVIGIHNAGGCDNFTLLYNKGTAITRSNLQNAIDQVAGPLNTDCEGAMVLSEGLNGPFDNRYAGTSLPAWPCGNGGKDLWFRYTSSRACSVTFDTCNGTNFDSVIQVFSGTCASLTSLGCSDDACGTRSSISVSMNAGQTYYLRVGGYSGSSGDFQVRVAPGPANGECIGALSLSLGLNGPFDSRCATTSAEPWPCGSQVGNDLWFRYDSVGCGPLTFRTCTATRNFDTVLQVFDGSCGALNRIACNDDACSTGSTVVVNPTVDRRRYYVRVGGYGGAVGNFDIEVLQSNGSFTVLPTGCGATTISASGDPVIGGTQMYALGNLVGTGRLWLGIQPIPPLPFCGAGPCQLGALPEFWLSTDRLAFTTPCDPLLSGAEIYMQGADLGSGPGGCDLGGGIQVTLTDTILIRIGG